MRAASLVAALAATGALSAGCDDEPDWVAPTPRAVALRADGETLQVWTGTPCEGVTKVDLVFDPGAADPVEAGFTSQRPRTVERVEVGRRVRGFTATERLPAGFEWSEFERVTIRITGDSGTRAVSADLGDLTDDAQPAGTYLVRDEWLDADEVLDRDGSAYDLLCSPDPAED